jgi:2-polyprenyl-6-hydroxyphenyl methylase/3-demethylubiquinone-9 3-methyltransferase
MKAVTPRPDWPDSWKYSHPYDLLEVFGSLENPGYRLAYETRRASALNALARLMPPPARVLDVAAAQGNFSLALAENGYLVTWNDVRAELAGYVRLKQDAGQIEFIDGNVFDINVPELFDAVLATEIIEHVAHPDRFLIRLGELIKPGGIVVLTTPNGAFAFNRLPKFSDCPDPTIFENVQFGPNSGDHIFLLHPDELLSFAAAANLTVEELNVHTTPLTAGQLKMRHLIPLVGERRILRLEAWARALPFAVKARIMVHMSAVFRKPLEAVAS